MKFQYFQGDIKNVTPDTRELTIANFLSMFDKHTVNNNKMANDNFVLATYKPNAKRNNSAAEAYTGAALDFDNVDLTIEAAAARIKDYQAVLYTSYSHKSEDKPNNSFRLVIPFGEPVDGDTFKSVVADLMDIFPEAAVESQHAGRAWFMPSCPEERAEHAKIILLESGEVHPGCRRFDFDEFTTREMRDAINWDEIWTQGRNIACARRMYHCLNQPSIYTSEEAVWTELRRYNNAYGNPLPDSEFNYIVANIIRRWKEEGKIVGLPSVPANELFIDLDDMMLEMKPTPWLVHGLLQRDSLSMISGSPGAGKSLFGLHLAAAIASGKDFHGRQVRQGPVVYCNAEGWNGLAKRMKAVEMIHGISAKDCKGNFFVSKRAMQVLSDNKLNAASAEVFAKAVGEIGIEPALVVIDTVGRSFGQGDENSAVDVNTFVEELDKAFRHKFGCNVLLIHHHGKNKSEARGSSAFLGAMDSQFDLNRLDDGQIELSCCKAKDGAQPEPIYFELKEVQLEILDEMTGKNETSVTLIKAQPKQKIDPMVKFLQAVNSGASSRDEIQATSNLRNDTISQLKKQAIEQELIKVAGGKQTVAGLTDKGQEYLLKHDDFGV